MSNQELIILFGVFGLIYIIFNAVGRAIRDNDIGYNVLYILIKTPIFVIFCYILFKILNK
jgi:hypothetical protein